MLNKLLLNNQLLTYKKTVQQAKIQVINKLVQKIRKFQNAIAKKLDNTKLITKLDRTKDILMTIKGLKKIDILKKSLLNEKNPTNIITNGNSKIEDIAYALLFKNKIIADVTQKLKLLLLLNENDNPKWKEHLINLGQRRSRKLLKMTKTKYVKSENIKTVNIKRNKNNWIEEDSTLKTVVADDSCKAINKPLEINEQNNSVEKTINISKANESTEHIRALDPFFIISTGENYMATIPHINYHNVSSIHSFVEKNNTMKTKNGKICQPGDKFSNKNMFRSLQIDKTKDFREFNKEQIKLNQISKTERKNQQKQTGTTEKLSSLHPSWEAKQKMKPKIEKFKGTKIVFD